MEDSGIKQSSIQTFDSGHNGLPWEVQRPAGFLAGIDFDAVLADPKAKEIIQALPPQPLYYGIKRQGLVESTEVLKHLTQDQFTRLIDYDVWQEDQIVPKKAIEWLTTYNSISSTELFDRLSNLDEEYQIAILSKKIQVYDIEAYENLKEHEKASLEKIGDSETYYKILSNDEKEEAAIRDIIKSLSGENLRYAQMLLAHAAYMPPSQTEFQLERFRRNYGVAILI